MDVLQEQPDTVILAEDEATLYLQATTCHVWSPRGQTPQVRVTPQRESHRFFGTLNLLTGHELVRSTAICNAQTTALHLQQILEHYPDVPILLLWDRAPWHSGAPIRELLAAHPRLELLSLPTAAPDLNPQEPVWKAVRHAVSHNHTTVRLADLATKWLDFLRSHLFPCSLLEDFNFLRLRNLSTAFT